MALVMHDIGVVRSDATLLEGVSFRVEPGQVVGILGPNGAGKSTLLRAISGEEAPTTGHIHYDDTALNGLSAREMASLRSLVPQSQATPFNFSTREILELGVDPSAAQNATQLVADVADELSLGPLLGRTASHLSGGEMQRVRIGRALLQLQTTGARYLLLDEPTSAQDPGRATLLADLLRARAARESVGVLVIVHDLNLAAQLCDRVILLKRGRLIAEGTPEAVLTQDILTDAFGRGLRVIQEPGLPPTVLPQLASSAARPIVGESP